MPVILQSILISLCTSALVGFFTFAFGMKSGKNQADRAKAQEIYTKLLNEFEAISNNLDTRPNIWSDYPQKDKRHKVISVTPLREIRSNGEYIYISEKQIEKLEALEKEALVYGWRVLELVEKIPSILNRNRDWFNTQVDFTESKQYNKPHVFNMKSDGAHRTYRYVSIYDFLDEKRLAKQLEEGDALIYNDERSPEHVCVTIIPDLLNITPKQFACLVQIELVANEDSSELMTKKSFLKKQLDEQVELLRKQARDPFPFWKTFGSAIRDIGKTD